MTGLKQPLETFKKAAKQLAKGVGVGDPHACERAARVLRDFSQPTFGATRALHVVAVEHGFPSWSELTRAPAAELYKALTKARRNRKFDRPTQERVREILRAHGVQIGEDVLCRPVHLLSIFPITGGGSATLSVAQEIAWDNARRRPWAIDLGHFQGGLSETQAAQLKNALDDEGIPFWERRGMSRYWMALKAPLALPREFDEIRETFGDPTSAIGAEEP